MKISGACELPLRVISDALIRILSELNHWVNESMTFGRMEFNLFGERRSPDASGLVKGGGLISSHNVSIMIVSTDASRYSKP